MMRPEFATNGPGETVAAAINELLAYYLTNWKTDLQLWIASAYFNPDGFNLVADALERIPSVRLLLGAEPSGAPQAPRHLDPDRSPERAEQQRVRDALAGHERDIATDRDLLGFDTAADHRAHRLIEWLGEGRVEVRRYEAGFLHGKAFVVASGDQGVLAGSSNFTAAGLARNLELNLGNYQGSTVAQVKDWFDGLWESATPFDLAAVYAGRFELHNPYLIYLRMLYERYGKEVEREAEDGDTQIRLAEFQRDGVWRARRIMDDYDGVLVADGVGLGKTFIAGELIREATMDRRQRVLVISPATLRDGPWRKFIADKLLPVEVISFEQLTEALGPNGSGIGLNAKPEQYAMVVIDEAHAMRNPDAQRASALRRLLQGTPPKKLVLLTATPVNNSLWDLYYMLSYFIRDDAEFADVGIRSLRRHFAEAMALDPEDLTPDKLFDVLDAVGVRRTRHFVKKYYPHDHITIDGVQQQIKFPKPRVLKLTYELDQAFPDFFDRFAHAISCGFDDDCDHSAPIDVEPVLRLARYLPSRYLKVGEEEPHETQVAGLLRSGLLKRFESSSHAFGFTCERMAAGHKAFVDLLDKGFVARAEALKEWMKSDGSDLDDLVETNQDDLADARLYDVDALRADVEQDRELLEFFAAEARKVGRDDDPKLAVLLDELKQIDAQAQTEGLGEDDIRDKRKVIVFTYYADTVEWIEGFLTSPAAKDLGAYKGRIIGTSGNDDRTGRASYGFAPRSSEAPPGRDEDLYDILVTTDVLAEGVNLQQARHVINYDLPWNPMRMVQRHGRVDRIGSTHDDVWIRCFLPDRRLDELLGLEEVLQTKITQAVRSVGVEDEVMPGSARGEVILSHTRDEIERLQQGDASLFETGGERDAYSGEEYRQELRVGLQALEDQIKRLAWGAGSGFAVAGARPGYVFCARVGDHTVPQFRFIDYGGEDGPEVVSDTLACLAHAQADADTIRILDDETHARAYDAWAIARGHIHDRWMEATDPLNLQPKIPKTLRDAAILLQTAPPVGYTEGQVNHLVDCLHAPWGERYQRVIRRAMRTTGKSADQSLGVAQAVEELGLQPPHEASALPLITVDDVHLVCWTAIVPK